jgi:hypothetical protein
MTAGFIGWSTRTHVPFARVVNGGAPETDQASVQGTTSGFEVGVTSGPTDSWRDVVDGSLLAEELGLDARNLWSLELLSARQEISRLRSK